MTQRVRRIAPNGVDLVVEVAAGNNAELDLSVLRPRGTISIYANEGDTALTLDIGRSMGLNARYQFVVLLTLGWDRIGLAAEDINRAIEAGALTVGEATGLPLHHFSLSETEAAHRSAESHPIGKVLVTVD